MFFGQKLVKVLENTEFILKIGSENFVSQKETFEDTVECLRPHLRDLGEWIL